MTEKEITEKVPSEEAAVFASSSIDRANVLTRTPKMKATIRRQSSLTNIPACEFNRNDSTTPNNVFSFPNNNNDDQQTNWTDVEMRQKCDQHQQMNGASAQNNPVEAAMLPNNSEKTQANSIVLAEQLELVTTQLNRALCSRMELQEELNLVKKHLENTSRDYEETMMERSSVLEENNRLTEERDRLKDSVKHLSNTLHNMINSKSEHQVQQLQSKLEHTRRLLQLNMEETALANSKREQTNEELERVRIICDTLEKERDQALFQLNNLDEQDEEPLFDCWINHSIQIALPSPSSTNLGVILGGGKGDEMFSSGMPIFVRDLIPGSPFDGHLKPLDFILNVNDIDVSTMDQRSVVDILSNSCNLKMVVKRRNDAFRVMEYSFNDISDLGAEFEDGVFISKIDENSGGAESGLTAGTRLIHVNGVPVRDASHTKALLDANKDNLVLGVMSLKTHSPRRQSTKPATINAPHPNKQRSRFLNKVHDKLFGRGNGASGSDKNRAIIAHANLDACIGELTSYRHGSLRIPTSRLSHSINHQLVRTGSLRTTTANAGGSHPITDPRQINEQLDKFFQRPSQSYFLNLYRDECKLSCLSHDDDGSVRTWPKSNEPSISNDSQSNHKTTNNRPSVLPAFSSTSNYPCAAITSTNSNNNNNNVNENGNALRRSTDIMLASPTNSHLSSYTHPHSHNNSSYMVDANPYHLVDHQPQISSPVRPYSWYRPPSSINNPPQSIYSASARIVTSTNLLLAQPKLIGIAHSQRVNSSGNTSTRSPALPQPPPYPGPRSSVDSLSIASSNSYPLPQSSSTTPTSYHPSFSPSGTILKGSDSQLLEEDEEIRRVVVNRDGCGGFGLALDNNENGGVVISNVYGPSKGRVHVGEQLLDVTNSFIHSKSFSVFYQ
ncbi:unnamed protein product [Anisakis simplex]|uniref:Disks large homolog 5 (inferred by orthology to a human protein) n=1 Tax=Anisakis simplex TaxID=6269 RepID=A0A0M3K4Q3_ANISI|nr:unnamed protein product [Anisakis simplex]